jgi:cobalt-zinc-cadmium efflux system membrane fusion protein
MTQKHVVSIVTMVGVAGLIVAAFALWGRMEGGRSTAAPDASAPGQTAASTKTAAGAEGIVRLSAAQIKQFGVETGVAGPGRLRVEVVLPGEVALNADRVAHVVPRVSGVVREVRKNLGDTVQRGEIMAILESRELADSTAAFLAAQERLNLAQSNFAREEQLWQKKISPEQDYIQAKNALAECRIGLRTTEQKLRALGFSDEYITKLPERPEKAAVLYEMAAPFDATIIEKHISMGEVLKEESAAFVIADLSSVWANLDVHQKDLPLIQVGQAAAIGVGNTAPSVEGRISFLEPIAEETNRTIHARVVLPNAGGRWRPGLFVTGRISVEDVKVPILVPNESLIMVGGKTCVFLKTGDKFRLQEITAGRTNGTATEILQGLDAGQTYVVKGAFTLKSELGKPEEEK